MNTPSKHPAPEAESPALLLPSTPRLLRGLRTAIAEMELGDRPDLQHATAVMDTVLSHLLLREDRAPYVSLYQQLLELARDGTTLLAQSSPTADRERTAKAIAELPQTLAPELGFDTVQSQIEAALGCVRECLQAVTLMDPGSDYPRRVQQAESQFYAANYRQAEQVESDFAPPMSKEGFETYLLEKFPGRYKQVVKFQRLVGGFQKETILVDAESTDGGIEAMVIRAEKHDRMVRLTASEITEEYDIVKLAWQHGITVAEPLWLEADANRQGRRFMVSRRAAGKNTGDSQGTSAKFPPQLTRSLIETLVSIHALPQDHTIANTCLGKWLAFPALPENTRQEILDWRHQIWMNSAPASPTFSRIFDWLEANVPEDEGQVCVLHNDYGPHNIMVDDNRVSAVLDWEVPRIGDPAEDLSFFLQCCGDAIDRAEALALYEQLSGHRVSEYRLRYFDVLSCAKVLLSGLSATTMFQKTEPALLDWVQMPVLWFGAYLPQVEDKIAAAEAARGR